MCTEERFVYAQTMFAQHPELFPQDRRQLILDGVVSLGMTPFEAKLAAGAFSFKVVADKKKWLDDSDPFQVMWAQSRMPDDSEIWMIFQSSRQFSGHNETPFRVYFKRGCAVKIEKLEGVK